MILLNYFYIFLICITISGVLCKEESSCNENELNANGLKCSLLKDYDPLERPVKNYKDVVHVNMRMIPVEINLADQNDQLTITAWMFMNWTDIFLKWEPKRYNGLDAVMLDCSSIWIPDIISLSILAEDPYESAAHMLCKVESSGNVSLQYTTSFSSYCSADRTYWPFDEHTCNLHLGSRQFLGPSLDISLEDVMTDVVKNGKEWQVKDFDPYALVMKTGGHENETYTRWKLQIVLKRHSSVYQTTFVFPGIGIAIIILAVLWLDVLSPERIYMLSLVIFNDIMFLEYFSFLFPSGGSRPPLLVKFFRDSVAISGICIVTTIISRILLNSKSKPDWLTALIRLLNEKTYIKTYLLIDISENAEAKDAEETPAPLSLVTQIQKEWRFFVTFFDRLLFILFTLVYLYLFLKFYPAI
ncbi:neuronal acetylcholine receptor subunit alpha-7-like [Lycorma delicatula]|uniref:neuronal acetylcholine receptor subunit alpha-7-like n=1 Tax=Lycorma delicatula TaxID=130591 RepID=UPI003F51819D